MSSKNYNVNWPFDGDQILLIDQNNYNYLNQTLEDAASFALEIMAKNWDGWEYDAASNCINWMGEGENEQE